MQSDKATVEISSRYDGEVVKVYADVGGIANVGEPLIDIRKPNSAQADANNVTPTSTATAPGCILLRIDVTSLLRAADESELRGLTLDVLTRASQGIETGCINSACMHIPSSCRRGKEGIYAWKASGGAGKRCTSVCASTVSPSPPYFRSKNHFL